MDWVDPCPLCSQPLELNRLQAHLVDNHAGPVVADLWHCGDCQWQGE